jgi:translation elongation factor EF-1beta
VIQMGEVIVKYKVMLESESMNRIDDVCKEIDSIDKGVGAVQFVEKKPLAFGLMFVEVTAIIQDGEEFDNPLGNFEDLVKSFEGVTEIETLEMGRL